MSNGDKGERRAAQGSIEYAGQKLEEYRQSLEVRVVERFDAASASGNHDDMRHCATVMSHFPRGATILVNVTLLISLPPPPLSSPFPNPHFHPHPQM